MNFIWIKLIRSCQSIWDYLTFVKGKRCRLFDVTIFPPCSIVGLIHSTVYFSEHRINWTLLWAFSQANNIPNIAIGIYLYSWPECKKTERQFIHIATEIHRLLNIDQPCVFNHIHFKELQELKIKREESIRSAVAAWCDTKVNRFRFITLHASTGFAEMLFH